MPDRREVYRSSDPDAAVVAHAGEHKVLADVFGTESGGKGI
jgi:hypothetical protein